MNAEKMKATAGAIARKNRKWGCEEAAIFLGAILKDEGLDKATIDAVCESAVWHGAVLNTSQFGQWADDGDMLGLGFKLRTPRGVKASKSVSDMLDDLQLPE